MLLLRLKMKVMGNQTIYIPPLMEVLNIALAQVLNILSSLKNRDISKVLLLFLL